MTNAHELDRRIQHGRELLAALASRDTKLLITRLQDARRGFPSGHEPPAPTVEHDEDGNPTSSAIGYSDRTGNLATTHDQVEADIKALSHHSTQFLTHLEALLRLADIYGRPVAAPKWCTSCKRDKGYQRPVAIGRYSDACRFCGDWRAVNKGAPPIEILRAQHTGQSITTRMLEQYHVKLPRTVGTKANR